MIHTKPRVNHRRGEKRLIEPKQTTSPSGTEKTSVRKKTFTVSSKPESSCKNTGINMGDTSL
jgi:hypothetical protein